MDITKEEVYHALNNNILKMHRDLIDVNKGYIDDSEISLSRNYINSVGLHMLREAFKSNGLTEVHVFIYYQHSTGAYIYFNEELHTLSEIKNMFP